MDILMILRVLLRRWLIVVPVLLVTVAIALSVGSGGSAQFASTGSVLLVSSAPNTGQPFLVVPGPVLSEAMSSAVVRERLRAAGAMAPYGVHSDPTNSILRIEATGANYEESRATVGIVLDALAGELDRLETQAGLSSDAEEVQIIARPPANPPSTTSTASGSAYLIPGLGADSNLYRPSPFATRVMTEVMADQEARRAVAEQAGGFASYVLLEQVRDTAPILTIAVTGTDPDVVAATFPAVVDVMNERLKALQDTSQIPAKVQTRAAPLNGPTPPLRTSRTVIKSVVTILGLGVLAATALAILVESVMLGRARTRSDTGVNYDAIEANTPVDIEASDPIDA